MVAPSRFAGVVVLLGSSAWSQDGASLPQALRVDGTAIQRVAADVVNVAWDDARVADLRHLARLSALRRLQLNPHGEDTKAWQNIDVDAIAALTALPALEQLTVPYCCHLTPAHLQKLAGCPRLADVMVINEAFVLDADVGRALATWPALRTLRLSLIRVTPKGLAALAAAPGLEELELANCRDLDADGFAAVTGLPRLRSLRLSGLGQPDMLARFNGGDMTPSWALDAAAAKRLAAMTTLRELSLTQSTMPVAHLLAALPAHLSALTLNSGDLDVAALRDLRRLGELRRLSLSDAYAADKDAFRTAVADLLGALHLESFVWQGELTPGMRDAIRTQPALRELAIPCVDDLAFVKALPKLVRLELAERYEQQAGGEWVTAVPTAEAVAVLRASSSLAVVDYRGTLRADVGAGLRAALGPKIEFLFLQAP
ncbi:MAG: hypothetical protein U1E73_03730 [Planctomycetota bacterium]